MAICDDPELEGKLADEYILYGEDGFGQRVRGIMFDLVIVKPSASIAGTFLLTR